MNNKNMLSRLEVIEQQLGQKTTRRWFQSHDPLVMVALYLENYFGVDDLSDRDFFNIVGIKSPYYLHGHCENLYDDNKKIEQQLIDFCHKHGLEDAKQNPSYFAAYIIAYYANFFEDGGKLRNGQLIDRNGDIVKLNLDWLIIPSQVDNEKVEDNPSDEIAECEEMEESKATKKRKTKTWRYPPAITLYDFD